MQFCINYNIHYLLRFNDNSLLINDKATIKNCIFLKGLDKFRKLVYNKFV